MREAAKRWDPELYPEIEAAGGLPQALQQVLDELGGDLAATGAAEPFPVNASVATPPRHTNFMIAAKERAFHAAFWDCGVHYGAGWTETLEEAAEAAHAFQVRGLPTAEMKSRYPWCGFDALAILHEEGPRPFVEAAWRNLLESLRRKPSTPAFVRLVPLVEAVVERPRLRDLMPFTSMASLGLSRTTGYPFASLGVVAVAIDEGRFRLRGGRGSSVSTEGDAGEIARAFEEHLPPDCGPAVHGTAEDLEA